MPLTARSIRSTALALLIAALAAPVAAQGLSGSDAETFIRLHCIDEPGREDLDLRLGFPDELRVDDPAARAFAAEYGERARFLHYHRGDEGATRQDHWVVPLEVVDVSRVRMTLSFECRLEANCILKTGDADRRARRLAFACRSPHLVLEILEGWIDRNVTRMELR